MFPFICNNFLLMIKSFFLINSISVKTTTTLNQNIYTDLQLVAVKLLNLYYTTYFNRFI